MTGRTVEEAVEAACTSLDLNRDEISYEVLEMPQKRLFGSVPAKVRVYANTDNFTMDDILSPGAKENTRDETNREIVETALEVDSIIQEKNLEVVPEKKQEVKPEVKPKAKVNPEIKQENIKQPETPKAKQVEVTKEMPAEINVESLPVQPQAEEKELAFEDMPVAAQAAFTYLTDVAGKMNLNNLIFKAVEDEGGVKFIANGDDAALLIGRRGETMEALQYLCLLVGNRSGGDYCRISFDVANYKSKREQSLQSQAKRVAEKVLKSRRNQTLESMSAYERRIIHGTIQDIKGVSSESIGNEPNRRVVVFIDGDRGRGSSRGGFKGRGGSSYGDKNDRSGRNDRNRGDRKPQKPATVVKQKTEPKERDGELEKNLYGKIDI